MNEKKDYGNIEKRVQRIFGDEYKTTRNAVFLLLFLVIAICAVAIVVGVNDLRKEQKEIRQSIELLYYD